MTFEETIDLLPLGNLDFHGPRALVAKIINMSSRSAELADVFVVDAQSEIGIKVFTFGDRIGIDTSFVEIVDLQSGVLDFPSTRLQETGVDGEPTNLFIAFCVDQLEEDVSANWDAVLILPESNTKTAFIFGVDSGSRIHT